MLSCAKSERFSFGTLCFFPDVQHCLWALLIESPPRLASRSFLLCCPQLSLVPSTSGSRSIEPTVLPLYCFFNRTLSSLGIIFLIGTLLLGAVVTPAVFRSAGRAGVGCCAFEWKDALVEQYRVSGVVVFRWSIQTSKLASGQ